MGPVKNPHLPEQRNSHTGPLPLFNLRAEGAKHGLYVSPPYSAAHRLPIESA